MWALFGMMDYVLPDRVVHKLVSTTKQILYISIRLDFCYVGVFLQSLFISFL